MSPTTASRALCLAFPALLAVVPVLQAVLEIRRGGMPGVLRVFCEWPTRESLAAFERTLEEESVTARSLRPWMQAGQFFALRDGGGKVLVGGGGRLFYTPGVNAITQRPQPDESTPREAVAAVTAYRDALAARGIRLLVVPVPNKESVYPQWLSPRSPPPVRIISPDTRAFFEGCAAAGVEIMNLFAGFRQPGRMPYYLFQDTHWSPQGLETAARLVAECIGTSGGAKFEARAVALETHGDLVRMMQSPVLEAHLAPERISAVQVPGSSAVAAPVLVLGDSFTRIFQTEEPGEAGFSAHLARHLGQPVASLVNDGGGATLVRQELFRRPQLLAQAKVVVWVFTERDLRLSADGWPIVPLPPPVASSSP
jgi:hypothetical protein